jgi:hypothetical protein
MEVRWLAVELDLTDDEDSVSGHGTPTKMRPRCTRGREDAASHVIVGKVEE